jgi:hypothetical protein
MGPNLILTAWHVVFRSLHYSRCTETGSDLIKYMILVIVYDWTNFKIAHDVKKSHSFTICGQVWPYM